jgi:hypothetical protein
MQNSPSEPHERFPQTSSRSERPHDSQNFESCMLLQRTSVRLHPVMRPSLFASAEASLGIHGEDCRAAKRFSAGKRLKTRLRDLVDFFSLLQSIWSAFDDRLRPIAAASV